MAQGVYTRMKRFTFVEKTVAEVGDYTDFPLEASSLDQIAEIYYRVKFAQFTENTLLVDYGGVYSGVSVSGSISPRVQFNTAMGIAYESMMNGYWTLDTVADPCYPASLPYLGDTYESTYLDYYNWSGGGGTITADFRDIGSDERGMLLPEVEGSQPIWNKLMPDLVGLGTFYQGVEVQAGASEQGFRTAFSWYSASDAGSLDSPTMPIPYIYEDFGGGGEGSIIYETLEVLVEFTGEVAVVKVNPTDSDIAPTNRYFLGVRFRALDSTGSFIGFTSGALTGSYVSSGCRYIIRLPSGDLTCALGSLDGSLTGDIVQEATEWWPYQDGAGNVWNPMTGLPFTIE